MKKDIKIIKMSSEDIDMVYVLEPKVFVDDPWPIEWFQEGVGDPEGYYYMAFFENELVGYCGMYHITSQIPNYCKIAKLGVKESFRRQGIGNALMLEMLSKARELGLDKVKLEVSTKNSAMELYKTLGFQIAELKEKYFNKSGDDAYIMWRYEAK